MELSEIIPHIEALIFASDRPLTSLDLVDLINNAFGFMEQQITLDQVETALEGIREKYNSDFYPFEVFQSGGGWQFLSKPAYHTTIAQLNGGKFLKKLSNAALETLSIIAYKQPITKGEIESIRGVNSDYSVQKLLEKELIIISGRNEELPGKPLIYETSKSFMDYFGLNSAADLPKIKEVLAEQFEPTLQQRNVEENTDFGIFSKFDAADDKPIDGTDDTDRQQAAADHLSEVAASESESEFESESAIDGASIDSDEMLELELSDEQNKESLKEVTEEMDQELHPDLSSIVPAAAVTSSDDEDEGTDTDTDSNIIEEEELADQEAEAVPDEKFDEEDDEDEGDDDDDEEEEEDDDEDDVEEEDEDDDDDDDVEEDDDEDDDEDDVEDDDDDDVEDDDDDDVEEEDEDEDEDEDRKSSNPSNK